MKKYLILILLMFLFGISFSQNVIKNINASTGGGGATPAQLAGKVDKTQQINGQALTGNITISGWNFDFDSVRTTSFTAIVGKKYLINAVRNMTITLPAVPADKASILFKVISLTSGKSVTVVRGGSDLINDTLTRLSLSTINYQGVELSYTLSLNKWTANSTDLSIKQLTTYYNGLYSTTYAMPDTGLVHNDTIGKYVHKKNREYKLYTLTGSKTLVLGNLAVGEDEERVIVSNGTYTLTLPTGVSYATGSPTFDNTNAKRNYMQFHGEPDYTVTCVVHFK
jgi:hypothetical protein